MQCAQRAAGAVARAAGSSRLAARARPACAPHTHSRPQARGSSGLMAAAAAQQQQDPVLQYVVLRRDLLGQWGLGAIVAQSAHASVAAVAVGLRAGDAHTAAYTSEERVDEMHKVRASDPALHAHACTLAWTHTCMDARLHGRTLAWMHARRPAEHKKARPVVVQVVLEVKDEKQLRELGDKLMAAGGWRGQRVQEQAVALLACSQQSCGVLKRKRATHAMSSATRTGLERLRRQQAQAPHLTPAPRPRRHPAQTVGRAA